ncbi:MAG TPA: deoxyribonuclease IV [bacterium]|nr:deoxyribonuclease IV [bacterium]
MRFGAHVSIRGAIHLAVDRAAAIGCECLQIFVGSPRQWREVVYPEDDLDRFIAKRRAAGLDPLVAHTAYLINLAAEDAVLFRRSAGALVYALRMMDRLDGLGAITHLGSRGTQSWRAALARLTAALTVALEASARAMILIEHSVGAGAQLGGTFEELAEIIDRMAGHPRLGVCLDSCHLFAAGWDLRTPAGVAATLQAFDRIVGLHRLRALHLNDSQAPLGSKIDRHANIGAGRIGLEGFRALVNHPRLTRLPAFIETPRAGTDGPDRRNLELLKRLRVSARAEPRRGRRGAEA